MQLPKGQGPYITQFATLRLPDKTVINVLMDLVAKIEEETDSVKATVAAECRSDVRRLETRLFDIRKTIETRLYTQDVEISVHSDDLVDLIRPDVKIEDGLSQV